MLRLCLWRLWLLLGGAIGGALLSLLLMLLLLLLLLMLLLMMLLVLLLLLLMLALLMKLLGLLLLLLLLQLSLLQLLLLDLLGRVQGARWRNRCAGTGAVARLLVLLGSRGLSSSKAGVTLWIICALREIRIEVKNLENRLRIALIVFLSDGRAVEKLGPFRRQADELASGGVKANVNGVGEVCGIAHTAHAGAACVDEVNPLVQVIIALHSDLKGLGGPVIVPGGGRGANCVALHLEDGAGGLDSTDVEDVLEIKSIGDLATFCLVEIESFFSQDQVFGFPRLNEVLAFLDLRPSLLYDGKTTLTIRS